MKTYRLLGTACILVLIGTAPLLSQEKGVSPPTSVAQPYQCLECHGESEMWEDEDRRFFVTRKDLEGDIHWAKGLRCHDCHGGDPKTDSYAEAHDTKAGFRALEGPKDIPEFCGRCHSDAEYMKRFHPSARTDQLSEYWTSGHGKILKKTGDPDVATCVSCHGHHGIKAVNDLESPVYVTRIAETCATCHADKDKMKGRMYHGRPLGHEQHKLWSSSVHGKALLENGDMAAPTCNDCHGNHGAMPPEVGSVANACGTCHGKVANLFENTRMRHQFEQIGLPGCATCHGAHDIVKPTDEMLGMGDGTVCVKCHADGKHGAPLTGGQNARLMRAGLERLIKEIDEADALVTEAEHKGMEVGKPRFELQGAHSALTNARTLIHGFSLGPVMEAINSGSETAASVRAQAEAALEEHTSRRVWLASSLIFIAVVIGIILVWLRRFPAGE